MRLDGVSKRFGTSVALDEAWLTDRPRRIHDPARPVRLRQDNVAQSGRRISWRRIEGEIFIDGALVTDVPAFERKTGIVFQNYALFPHMTVANNVAYGLKARGVAKEEIRTRVAEVLAMMKLTGFEDRKPRQLSGGQQQRVALARALVIRPKVLLLDEPFSALDKNLRASMQVEVKEIQRRLGVTTIFVTHDQSEALSLSDRIAVMSGGRICQIDTPEQLYRQARGPFRRLVHRRRIAVCAARLGGHRAAIVPMIAVGTTHASRCRRKPLDGVAPGAMVDLFIRPGTFARRVPGRSGAVDGHGRRLDLSGRPCRSVYRRTAGGRRAYSDAAQCA